ncbi:hypothetical protein M569_11856 [Genlisea aurea]|uniref:S-protein homolog n=1 Tax=Genlisea aurea TaxID=192259 RepID=S8DJB4_9LAMI|nr:hypothetical protein M569_11856 [Genlisea aurea]
MRTVGAAVLVVLLVFSSSLLLEACLFSKRHHMMVVDRINADDNVPLKVHCFSGNNDFGYHFLVQYGVFDRSFCENALWDNTKIFCHVWWGNKNQGFIGYDQERDLDIRSNFWLVFNDGIYLSHDNMTMIKKYDWA